MTWAEITSRGWGKIVGYRLTIEGWPDVWVSDPLITYTTNLDGRTVRTGLKTEGLGFSEQLNLQEARTIVRGFTAKIVSTDQNDHATSSFSTFNRPVAYLEAELSDTATTINTGPNLSNSTYYHIGTETILVGTYPTISRKHWNTHAQKHPGSATGLYGDPALMPVYDKPPTMEGRRANLFVYAEGDSMTGDGTIVFRGIVSKPPTLDSDGLTWSIQVNPITDLLGQHIAAQNLDAKLYGIYHHNACPFYMRLQYDATASAHVGIVGLYDDLDSLIAAVNDQIATQLTNITATGVDSLVMEKVGQNGERLIMRLQTNATACNFAIDIGSPLVGFCSTTHWYKPDPTKPGFPDQQGVWWDSIATNTEYIAVFGPESPDGSYCPFPETPVGNQMTCLGEPGHAFAVAGNNASPWRVYVDKDLSDQVAAGTYVHIDGIEGFAAGAGRTGGHLASEGGAGDFEVSGQGTDVNAYYIDFVPRSTRSAGLSPGVGFLNGETRFVSLRDYGEGDITAFRTGITTESVDANWGDTPFITAGATAPYGDLATWDPDETVSSDPTLWNREYVFAFSKSVGEILREECKMIAHHLYLDADFRIALRRFPAIGANMTSDTTIDTGDIVTPDGKRGMWPGWTPQRDGLVNEVTIQEGYDPVEDDWKGRKYVIRDVTSISEHKSRGKGKLEVKPYSQSESPIFPETATRIGEALMSVLARDYIQVTVRVPLSMFGLLVGDVVLFTCPQVPNGSGARGMTNQRAVVWGRRWNLDPTNAFGELTLYVPTQLEGGYCPSGYITSQVNDSGDTWTITCLSSNDQNLAWSENGDGKITDHFAAGDYVEVMKLGDSGETRVTGTVDSVDGDNDAVTVSFDSTWTPGSDQWVLEFRKDTGSTATARQQGYTYTADSNFELVNGTAAWRYV